MVWSLAIASVVGLLTVVLALLCSAMNGSQLAPDSEDTTALKIFVFGGMFAMAIAATHWLPRWPW